MREGAWKTPLSFYLYSRLYRQLVRGEYTRECVRARRELVSVRREYGAIEHCGVMSVRTEKFSFLLVCALVIELFIVALILTVYFLSLLLPRYHLYCAYYIVEPIIILDFY